MKRKPIFRLTVLVIIFLVIMQTILSSCAQIPPNSAPLVTITITPARPLPVSATIAPTGPLPISITITPTPHLKIKLDEIPENCSFESISPDAVWIAIVCFHLPSVTLKIGKIGETEKVTILDEKGAALTFSPDSKKLLAVTRDAIWLFNVGDWQNPKKLLSVSGGATWSPDSQLIAFNYLVEGYALSIFSLDGTVKNILTYDDVHKINGPGNDFFGPAWSPDSKKIAYVSTDAWQPQPVQIRTVEISTGEKELLYSGKPGEVGFGPAWSPDGKKITVGTFLNESHPIYIYDIGEKTFTAVGDFYFGYSRGWSPDSKYLAISDNKGLHVISTATNQDIDLDESDSFLGWKGNDHIIIQQNSGIYLIPFP